MAQNGVSEWLDTPFWAKEKRKNDANTSIVFCIVHKILVLFAFFQTKEKTIPLDKCAGFV